MKSTTAIKAESNLTLCDISKRIKYGIDVFLYLLKPDSALSLFHSRSNYYRMKNLGSDIMTKTFNLDYSTFVYGYNSI